MITAVRIQKGYLFVKETQSCQIPGSNYCGSMVKNELNFAEFIFAGGY